MNAIELYKSDGKPCGIFYCEKCLIVHRDKEAADRCCDYKCHECGGPVQPHHTRCSICRDAELIRRENERFEKAQKVTEWPGWVYVEGLGCGNGYFASVDDLLEFCEDDEIMPPDYAWTCEENHFVNADISDITERMDNDAPEDWDTECLNGLDELKKAIEVFNKANKDEVAYSPNYKVAVLINKESLTKKEK